MTLLSLYYLKSDGSNEYVESLFSVIASNMSRDLTESIFRPLLISWNDGISTQDNDVI